MNVLVTTDSLATEPLVTTLTNVTLSHVALTPLVLTTWAVTNVLAMSVTLEMPTSAMAVKTLMNARLKPTIVELTPCAPTPWVDGNALALMVTKATALHAQMLMNAKQVTTIVTPMLNVQTLKVPLPAPVT